MAGAFSVLGINEQIFGADEQIPERGLGDQVGATPYDVVYPHNAERVDPGHMRIPVAGVST